MVPIGLLVSFRPLAESHQDQVDQLDVLKVALPLKQAARVWQQSV